MNNNWILLAFISTLITAIGTIGLKIIDKSKYNNNLFLALTFIVMGLISFFYLIFDNTIKNNFINNCDKYLILFVLFFAILLILNNVIMQYAFKISPNIGYSHIIINLNVILTVFAGYFLFKQQLDNKCLFGILLALIGIMIVVFYSNK